MEKKIVAILGSLAAAGVVATGVILAVRMPKEATPGAFTAFVNATSRGLAIAENSIC